MTKFLIVGDLHGKLPRITTKNFDHIICVGDFFPSSQRKIIFKEIKRYQKEGGKLRDWFDIIGKREAKKIIKSDLATGRKILEKLCSFNKPIFLVPGNADYTPSSGWKFRETNHFAETIQDLNQIKNCHNKLIMTKEFNIIGYGINSGPEFPQYEDEIESIKPETLEILRENFNLKFQAFSKLFNRTKKSKKPTIFLSHNVPFNTKLDLIKMKASPRNGEHCGSFLTRELIKKFQPQVCIGGHIHESPGKEKIKNTVCLNTGLRGIYLYNLERNSFRKVS
jgi:Icc-related predicted phosphoesterase